MRNPFTKTIRVGVTLFAWLAMSMSVHSVVSNASEDDAEPSAEAVLGVAPFEDTSEVNRIIINLAREGNRPLTMILDTGASHSVLTPLFARKLGVTIRRTKNSPYRRGTFLGRDLQFYVDTSSSDTGSRTGFEYGLLGGKFLAEYVVELDFKGRRVRFLDRKKYRVPKQVEADSEVVVPLRVVSNRPIVRVEMNGKPLSVLLDTGAHDPLILSGAAAKKLGVDVDALPLFGTLNTVMGSTALFLHETESFVFGGFAFGRMPVFVAPKGWYNQGAGTDSVVGYDTLSQFTIRIDYPRQRMWMRRESSESTFMGVSYEATSAIGLFVHAVPGAYRVVGVVPGSQADQFGLLKGDAFIRARGEESLTLEQVIQKVADNEPLLVSRRADDDTRVGITLPEASTTPDVGAEPGDATFAIDPGPRPAEMSGH